DLERERRRVVVVDDDARIGGGGLDPVPGGGELGEVRRPVGLGRAAPVDRGAHRGHVRAADAPDDPRHQPSSGSWGSWGSSGSSGSSQRGWPGGSGPPVSIIRANSSGGMPVCSPARSWNVMPSQAASLYV